MADIWKNYAKNVNNYAQDMYYKLLGYDEEYIDKLERLRKDTERLDKDTKAAEIRRKQLAEDIKLAKQWADVWREARKEDESSAKAAALTTVNSVEKAIEEHNKLRVVL